MTIDEVRASWARARSELEHQLALLHADEIETNLGEEQREETIALLEDAISEYDDLQEIWKDA